MNGIRSTYNFITEQWTFETNLAPSDNVLDFVFISETEYSNLSDNQFGFRLESNGAVLSSKNFPPPDVKYVQVSRAPWIADTVSLIAGQEYKLVVYLMKPDETVESQIVFTGPRPVQPYPSWIWANNQWNSPKEKPAGPYSWDEQNQQWVRTEPNFPYPIE